MTTLHGAYYIAANASGMTPPLAVLVPAYEGYTQFGNRAAHAHDASPWPLSTVDGWQPLHDPRRTSGTQCGW